MTYSSTVTSLDAPDTTMFTSLQNSDGFTWSWFSSDLTKTGTYVITITATAGCSVKSAIFNVQVLDCNSVSVTPDTVLLDTLEYVISNP